MLAALKERKPTVYETALTKLGYLLGAEAQKPPASGRCDSTWCWDHHLWLAIDAKSDHEPSGLVSQKDIRQAGDQLRLLKSDRTVADIPPDSATVIVSPNRPLTPPVQQALRLTSMLFTRTSCLSGGARMGRPDGPAPWAR